MSDHCLGPVNPTSDRVPGWILTELANGSLMLLIGILRSTHSGSLIYSKLRCQIGQEGQYLPATATICLPGIPFREPLDFRPSALLSD